VKKNGPTSISGPDGRQHAYKRTQQVAALAVYVDQTDDRGPYTRYTDLKKIKRTFNSAEIYINA